MLTPVNEPQSTWVERFCVLILLSSLFAIVKSNLDIPRFEATMGFGRNHFAYKPIIKLYVLSEASTLRSSSRPPVTLIGLFMKPPLITSSSVRRELV